MIELGLDAAINHKHQDVTRRTLRELAPEGIDVCFDKLVLRVGAG
jgi:NADPH-dependent curcumin reductase CurA